MTVSFDLHTAVWGNPDAPLYDRAAVLESTGATGVVVGGKTGFHLVRIYIAGRPGYDGSGSVVYIPIKDCKIISKL